MKLALLVFLVLLAVLGAVTSSSAAGALRSSRRPVSLRSAAGTVV